MVSWTTYQLRVGTASSALLKSNIQFNFIQRKSVYVTEFPVMSFSTHNPVQKHTPLPN